MSERDFSEVLNHCIDRIAAGESIEACLQDYPEHAERLGDLLQMGELVHRAIYPDAEVTDAQARVHSEVLEAMSTYASGKRKRKNRELERRHEQIVMLAAAAATIIIVLGIALVTLVQRDGGLTGVAIRNTDAARLAAQQTETEIACQTLTNVPELAMAGTQTPETMLTMTLLPTPTAMGTAIPEFVTTSTPTMRPVGTVPPAVEVTAEYVATSVALMSPEPPPDSEVPLQTPTSVPMVVTAGAGALLPTSTATSTGTPMPTPTAQATMPPAPTMPPMGTPVAMLTATVPPMPPTPTGLLPEIMPLNAGEIDDNADWDTYLAYRNNYLSLYAGSVHDVDVTGRQIIRVVDDDGLPVIGARVRVYDGQTLISESCTYADGRTLFFPNAQPAAQNTQSFRVVVEKDNAAAEFTIDPGAGFVWDVTLEGVQIPRDSVQLDVLFLLDSTGSMSDEIAELQNNILHISAQIDALGGIDTRYGLVTYRDRTDDYIVRNFGFSADLSQFQTYLNSIVANGGGDHPESVNEALHDAIHRLDWRGGNTVQLIFLVADAEPHLDYPQDYDYAQEMVVAAQNGIKIHPIASSGLQPAGEYIFRQIAQYTMGHFVFLTYDEGGFGAPGTSRDDLHVGEADDPDDPQDDGDYTVEQLDELVLRLITDELVALRGEDVQTASAEPLAVTQVDQPPCMVEIRQPPATAPTRIPSGPGKEARYVDPHVAMCMSEEMIRVGNTFRIYAQAVDIGLPIYELRLTDENDGQFQIRVNPSTMELVLEDDALANGLELVAVEMIDTWNVAFVLRAQQPGTLQGDIHASGEIHYGYPGPATWSGGFSDVFSFEVLGG
jgi:hypothetical protein